MSVPTFDDVVAFAGTENPHGADAEAHLDVVVALVRSYTRGVGFEDYPDALPDDLAAVIVSACARSLANPAAVRSTSIGVAGEVTLATVHVLTGGLTFVEQVILNRYRQRTA